MIFVKSKGAFTKKVLIEFLAGVFCGMAVLLYESQTYEWDILQVLAIVAPWLIYRFFAYKGSPKTIEITQGNLTIEYENRQKRIIALAGVRQILFRRTFLIIIPNSLEKSLNVGLDGYSSDDIDSLKQTLRSNPMLAGEVVRI